LALSAQTLNDAGLYLKEYALEQVSGMGVQGEYVFDGSFQGSG
jgi:hypothetical protein